MTRYVLYHGNCYDGFGAAWSARHKYGDQNTKYIPVSYGHEPPDMPVGSVVLILDFSYSRKTLLDMTHKYSVHVEDHHKTAEVDLQGLDFCHFDMDRSGAMLTWNYLYPNDEPPLLIQYVQDRDLWRFELPHSKEVSAWLGSYPFDFALWERLNRDFNLEEITREGTTLLRLKERQINDMCRNNKMQEIGGYLVPVANATVNFSEVGERLCEMFPDAPFAAYYLDRNDGHRQWGLRSRNGFDVSEIAKMYGGGGHAAAAGFVTTID